MASQRAFSHINFNFSDDSDNENDCSNSKSPNGKVLQAAANHKTDLSGNPSFMLDKTIAASDLRRRSELPSLCEELGLPVTESTRLYSSDVFSAVEENNQSQRIDARLSKDLQKPGHKTVGKSKTKTGNVKRNTAHLQSKHPKPVSLAEREEDLDANKENFEAGNDKDDKSEHKQFTPKLLVIDQSIPKGSSTNKSATDNQNQLEWDELQGMSLKGSCGSTKRLALYGGQNFLTPVCADECRKGRKRNINPLMHGQLIADNRNLTIKHDNQQSLSEESNHSYGEHEEYASDCYVEVQDMSTQTSFRSPCASENGNFDNVLRDDEESSTSQRSRENCLTFQPAVGYVDVQDISPQTSYVDSKENLGQKPSADLHHCSSSDTDMTYEIPDISNCGVSFDHNNVDGESERSAVDFSSENGRNLPLKKSVPNYEQPLLQFHVVDSSSMLTTVEEHSTQEISKSSPQICSISSTSSGCIQGNEESLFQTSYEVQDVSIQASLLECSASDSKIPHIDSSCSPICCNDCTGLKLAVPCSHKDSGTHSVIENSDTKEDSSLETAPYETAFEKLNDGGDDCSTAFSSSNGNSNLEEENFNPEVDESSKKSLYETACENHSYICETVQSESSSSALKYERFSDPMSESTLQKDVQNFPTNFRGHETSSFTDDSNIILAAASDNEDENCKNKVCDEWCSLAMDKINESDVEPEGCESAGYSSESSKSVDTSFCLKTVRNSKSYKKNDRCSSYSDRGQDRAMGNCHKKSIVAVTKETDDSSDDDRMDIKYVHHNSVTSKQRLGKAKKTVNCDDGAANKKQESAGVNLFADHSNSDHGYRKKAEFDDDRMTEKLEGISFAGRIQTKGSESSDDDSDFENFLNKMKNPARPVKRNREMPPLNEFIVDDDEVEEAGSSAADEENDYDEMFYIKTNKRLDTKRERHNRHQKVLYTEFHSDNSQSSDESDSDLDDFIVDKPPKKTSNKTKHLVCSFDHSSDDELSEKTLAKPPSKYHSSKWNALSASSGESDYKSGKCGTISTPSTNKTTPKVPETDAHRLLSDSGDVTGKEHHKMPAKTPFKTPRALKPWQRPFETPANTHRDKAKDDFKTPSISGDPALHPSTAPRPPCPSIIGLDEDAYFLKSLTADYADYKRHPDAARYVKRFKDLRADLAYKLFKIFNHAIFEDQLPKDFEIEWSTRYRKTAGTFYYKGTSSNFKVKVTLSVKVCDNPERVRDTLAHELCHAAVKLINGANESHGRIWKSWARRTNRIFPFMPVIARCHDYTINTKYTYQCVNCKYRIGRHSKSLDTDKKVCGHCRGRFEVYLTSELNSSSESCKTPATPRTPRTPNKFALFVKECYSDVKKREGGLTHGDVMKILSKEFAEKNKICE